MLRASKRSDKTESVSDNPVSRRRPFESPGRAAGNSSTEAIVIDNVISLPTSAAGEATVDDVRDVGREDGDTLGRAFLEITVEDPLGAGAASNFAMSQIEGAAARLGAVGLAPLLIEAYVESAQRAFLARAKGAAPCS